MEVRLDKPVVGKAWHVLAVDEVLEVLRTTDEGLRTDESRRRLATYGPNEIEPEQQDPWWAILLHQFKDPLIYILLVAAFVTFAVRDFADSGVVMGVVLLNALIGFVQERRAQKDMLALSRLSPQKAEVLRDGHVQNIPSREVVPGDVVLLASGARVPADMRMVRTTDLHVDESALTGESLPVSKSTASLEGEVLVAGDKVNLAFAGTTVTRGRGRGVVIRTGPSTELGQIAEAVRELSETHTPLQEKIERFGRQIGLAVVALAGTVGVVGVLQALAPYEIFLAMVAMAVSAIPEGLPVVLTITFSIGVRRMARRNAIVRSLPAVETLGSATVIGSDKTGTLTKNEMTVREVWADGRLYEFTGAGYATEGDVRVDAQTIDARSVASLADVLRGAVLANEADASFLFDGEATGDPTEMALYVAAMKGGMNPLEVRDEVPQIDLLPFEPERRYMAALVEVPKGRRIYVKGAPEVVLRMCRCELGLGGATPLDEQRARSAAADLAAKGYRVLAVAYRSYGEDRILPGTLDGEMVLCGFIGMEDPVRPEAIEAVRDARSAGMRVIMLTGDHAATALAIGQQLNLDHDRGGVVEGREIDALSDEELDGLLHRVSIFARVAPEHKLRIVQQLKSHDEIVAVTGDGVNDAPALRAAHVGIAMGKGGTDVARDASDLILTDDNFATITAAVEEGRVVFSNVRKVTFFLLSTAVGEIIAITLAIFLGWPLPFVAVQILWINLVTNGLQDVALAFETGEPGLLRRPPRPPSEGIVTRRLLERLGSVGAVLAAGTLGMFWWTLETTGDLATARTIAMTQMVSFQFFHVLNCRSLDRSIFSIPFFSNRFLFLSIVAAAAAHLMVLYVPGLQAVFRTVPLSASDWLVILGVSALVIVGGEFDKWWNRRRNRPLG